MNITFFNKVTDDFKLEVETFISLWENQSDFIELKTSGSTGIPKSIIYGPLMFVVRYSRELSDGTCCLSVLNHVLECFF